MHPEPESSTVRGSEKPSACERALDMGPSRALSLRMNSSILTVVESLTVDFMRPSGLRLATLLRPAPTGCAQQCLVLRVRGARSCGPVVCKALLLYSVTRSENVS